MNHKLVDECSSEHYSEIDQFDEESAVNRFCRFTGRMLGDIVTPDTPGDDYGAPVAPIDYDAREALEEDRFFGSGAYYLTSEIWSGED